MTSNKHIPLEELLDEIIMNEAKPSHDALTRWSDRFPEHRDALARFFATWAIQEALPKKGPAVDEARAGQRMVSQALNLLYQQNAACTAPVEAEKTPTRLCEAVKSCRLSLDDFAARCGLDESIVLKLDRRRIRYLSIPRKCFERIDAVLGRGVELIQTMFMGEPVPVGNNKTHGKPVISAEDFLDAVRASDLPAQTISEWVQAVAAENMSGDTI